MRSPPLLAMIGFSMLGNSSLVVQPMIVGGMVDELGFTEQQAGLIASVELSGLSLGMLLLVGISQRIPRGVLAAAGVVTVVVTNVTACGIHEFQWMLLVRFLAGTGAAMALAVFLAMGAAEERPENTFAVVNALSIAYSGVFTPFAPAMLAAWKLPGLFLTLAAVALLMLPLTFGLDPPRIARRAGDRPARSGSGGVPARVIMLLLMMFLLYCGHGSIWAYQQRIGVGLGLSSAEVGKWIGLSMLIGGVSGSLIARALGMKLGRVWPQVLSLGVSAVGAVMLVVGSTPEMFASACGLVALSWFYGLPYQMGLLAAFDPRGRANMAGLVMTTGGSAAGPALAAMLITQSGHAAIGAFAGLSYLLSLALALPAAIDLNRTSSVAAADSNVITCQENR
jgi:predicted MFS family arabinose efflux permease